MKKRIDRRTFLRNGSGTMLALPLLESMFLTDSAFAAATTDAQRFFSFYVPNGTIEKLWYPKNGTKTNFNLSGTALAPFQEAGLKNEISLYQGLHGAGKAGGGNAHMRAIAGFLTGTKIPNDRVTTHKVSIDQAFADHHASSSPTKIHSLQLAGNPELDKPNNNQYNNQLKNALCFDKNGRLLPNTANLKGVFDRLFTGIDPNDANQQLDERTAMQLSVLDSVKQERDALMTKLGADDRLRLEEYFNSLRELENRIGAVTPPDMGGGCSIPNVNPPRLSDTARNNEIGEHCAIMAKIMAAAFRCDLTRSVTYLAGGEAAGCSYSDIGINKHFHNTISHNQGAHENLHHRIDTYHSELVANVMLELRNTPHGTGNLLDGTGVIYGAGLGNGDRHSHDNISILVGGRFGNFEHGRHHKVSGNHAQLINTVYRELGLPGSNFGDAGGRVLPIS